MGSSSSFIRRNYTPEYFNNSSEPHRRRPAIVNFPCTIWHVALYHHESRQDRRRFVDKIVASLPELLKGWRVVRSFSKDPNAPKEPPASVRGKKAAKDQLLTRPLDEMFLRAFFTHEWFTGPDEKQVRSSSEEEERENDTVFCFECVPELHNRWTLRFELHTEYFTFTVFTDFKITKSTDSEIVVETFRYKKGAPDYESDSISSRDVGNLLTEIFAKHRGFVADPDLPKLRHPGPICGALQTIIRESGNQVFCDFRGVVTDWTLFTPEHGDWPMRPRGTLPKPNFCPENQNGFDTDDHSNTQRFLDGIWEGLKETVFSQASENLVGCYMQNGHAIYLSALGAQGLPPDSAKGETPQPLTFLVIYDKPSRETAGANPHRWRMSRLINSLIEVGVRRVASLRNLQQLREAGDGIRGLENTLDTISHASLMKYRDLRDHLTSLDTIHDRIQGSLAYRANRASKHAYAMRSLIADLEVVNIPGWLPYDQFVKRRLMNTQEDIARLIPRVRALEESIRVRLQLVDTRVSLLVAMFGSIAAGVVVTGAVFDAFAKKELFGLSWGGPLANPLGMLIGGVGMCGIWFLARWRWRTGRPVTGPYSG